MVLNAPCSWAIPSCSKDLRFEGDGGMKFRTAGAVAALTLGLAAPGDQTFAQYYPSQAYPPQQVYPSGRPLPPLAAADDDVPLYNPPVGRPVPPAAVGRDGIEPLPPPGL